jgi:hypothetical protein
VVLIIWLKQGVIMKKLYLLLLSYTVCLSPSFASGSPSGEFDDCDKKVSPRDRGCVAPPTTPQVGLQQSAAEEGSRTQAPLPESTGDRVDSSGAYQTILTILNEDEDARAQDTGVESPQIPDLKFFYTKRDGEGTRLERFTREMLMEAYKKVIKPGDAFEVMFVPEVGLRDVTGLRNHHPISVFDTVGWMANIRAWAKWWLNPWAWWTPSRYALDNKSDRVEWNSLTSQATIHVAAGKDVTYLTSQLRLFLLRGWSAQFAPYIAPSTQEMLERAVKLRFDNVEKPALEAIGFKDITLGTRINPVTHGLDRCIHATKYHCQG